MDIDHKAQEFDAQDTISVFSFCIPPDKKTYISVDTTSHSLNSKLCNSQILTAGSTMSIIVAEEDEVRSMMDFFIGAEDFDSSTANDNGEMSNCKTRTSDTTIDAEDALSLDESDSVCKFEKTRELLKTRTHKIHKKMAFLSQNCQKRQTGLNGLFLESRKFRNVNTKLWF